MRILTELEIEDVSGFGTCGSLGLIGGVLGAFAGASLGFSITGPLAAYGAICALVPQTGVITEGLLISAGFLGAGIIGGALIGGAIGWALGTSFGYAINYIR